MERFARLDAGLQTGGSEKGFVDRLLDHGESDWLANGASGLVDMIHMSSIHQQVEIRFDSLQYERKDRSVLPHARVNLLQ